MLYLCEGCWEEIASEHELNQSRKALEGVELVLVEAEWAV